MQMKLPFLDNPPFRAGIWESLDNVQRDVVLNKLAQLIAKTTGTEIQKEEKSDE